jgi:regulator of replication initiation timing
VRDVKSSFSGNEQMLPTNNQSGALKHAAGQMQNPNTILSATNSSLQKRLHENKRYSRIKQMLTGGLEIDPRNLGLENTRNTQQHTQDTPCSRANSHRASS